MDARVDPQDHETHAEALDLLRRADYPMALELFTRLLKLAHNQGQIDAYMDMIGRIAGYDAGVELEANMAAAAARARGDA